MPNNDPETGERSSLFSIPRMAALAVVGVVIVAASRLLGTEVVFREVATEVVASIGSAALVLAAFGLLFGSGLERRIRRAPGGELYAESVRHVQDVLQAPEGRGDAGPAGYEERLDRIERDLKSLTEEALPDLKDRIEELRELVSKAERGT